MNKTTTFLSLAAVAVLSSVALTSALTNAAETSSVSSATNTKTTVSSTKGFGRSGNKKDRAGFKAFRDALKANDYNAFQSAVKDLDDATHNPFAEKITTQQQFEQLVKMHTLLEEGNVDEAKTLAEQLDLPLMGGGKGGHGKGWLQKGNPEVMQAIHAAITANDYTAFQAAIKQDTNSPFARVDSAEKFAKLVTMQGLLDQAQAIATELALPGHGFRGVPSDGELPASE